MRRVTLYAIAKMLGDYLAIMHTGHTKDVVLYHQLKNVLAYLSGRLLLSDYQHAKAVKMLDETCINRLALIQRQETERGKED